MTEGREHLAGEDGDLSISNGQDSESDLTLSPPSHPNPRYLVAPEFAYCKPSSFGHEASQNSIGADKESQTSAIVQSTTFLHAYDRPSDLPQKNPQEARRHRIECDKMNQYISKRHHESISKFLAEQENRHLNETKFESRVNYWRDKVIPNWDTLQQNTQLLDDWWLGIPSPVRSEVWRLIIGNPLGITRDLFDSCLARSSHIIRRLEQEHRLPDSSDLTSSNQINFATAITPTNLGCSNFLFSHGNNEVGDNVMTSLRQERQVSSPPPDIEVPVTSRRAFTAPTTPLASPYSLSVSGDLSSNEDSSLLAIRLDVSRTFPMLGAFQSEGSHNRNLHDLLAAFVAYQPALGYLQGMSFIAGILLLVLDDIYAAFIAFATLMNRPSFYAFYSLDESEFSAYFGAFDSLLEDQMPRLSTHLKSCRLDCNFYLFDWLFTVFSRSLPLHVNLRIWDLFLRDGEAALLLAALGILRMYEDRLLLYDFDRLASFLTGPMPESMSPDHLVSCMRSLGLSIETIKIALNRARKSSDKDNTLPLADFHGDFNSRTLSQMLQAQSEDQRRRWGLLGVCSRRTKPQISNVNTHHKSESTVPNSKSPSFRREPNASSLLTAWSREVCLNYPKRDIL